MIAGRVMDPETAASQPTATGCKVRGMMPHTELLIIVDIVIIIQCLWPTGTTKYSGEHYTGWI